LKDRTRAIDFRRLSITPVEKLVLQNLTSAASDDPAQVFVCYLKCGNAFGILKDNRSGWITESIALRSVAFSVDLG
jgi:hypothetical protein